MTDKAPSHGRMIVDKLVERIPTPEMIAAAWTVVDGQKRDSGIARIGPGLGVREIWQAMFDAAPSDAIAQKRVNELEVALRDIPEPLAALRRDAEARGHKLSGMANQIANDPEHLKSIARAALPTMLKGNDNGNES